MILSGRKKGRIAIRCLTKRCPPKCKTKQNPRKSKGNHHFSQMMSLWCTEVCNGFHMIVITIKRIFEHQKSNFRDFIFENRWKSIDLDQFLHSEVVIWRGWHYKTTHNFMVRHGISICFFFSQRESYKLYGSFDRFKKAYLKVSEKW